MKRYPRRRIPPRPSRPMVWATMILSVAGVASGSVPEGETEVASTDSVVLVIGAPGTDEYARMFQDWADRWIAAANAGQATVTVIGRDNVPDVADRDQLQTTLSNEQDGTQRNLWLVLIGHGTFDGRLARFNLRGADVAAGELADWLQDCDRPLAIINCSSSSAPFIDRLAGPERIVVTSTRSGAEENFSRFGDYLSRAIADRSADLDKDGQVSLLEAFLRAARQTQAYYDGQRQLATEHALLDDNGDARGVQADFFAGLQQTRAAEGGGLVDGIRAHQWNLIPSSEERQLPLEMRRRRDELERQLAELRQRKAEFKDQDYYRQIEPFLVEIARLYASVDSDDTVPSPEQSTEGAGDDAPDPRSR